MSQYTLPLNVLRRISSVFGGKPTEISAPAGDWGDLVAKLMQEERYHYYSFDIAGTWIEVAGGGGACLYRSSHIIDIRSNAVAGGSYLIRTERYPGWMVGIARNQIQWDRPIMLSLLMTGAEGSANGERRITLGKNHADTIASLADKGVGLSFGLRGAAPDYLTPVTGLVHDGVGADDQALGNVTGYYTHQYLIVSDGAGNIDFYIDGVLINSSANGPVGLSTANFCVLQMEVDNNGDNAHNVLELHDARILIDNGA